MIAFAKDYDGRTPWFRRKDFELTGAISVLENRFVPQSGFLALDDIAVDPSLRIRGFMVAVTKDQILPTLKEILEVVAPGDNQLDFIVDSFCDDGHTQRTSKIGENVPRKKIEQTLESFKDLLLNDGHHAYAFSPTDDTPCEVQLDNHKLIIIYYRDNELGELLQRLLADMGLDKHPTLSTVLDVEHVHKSKHHHKNDSEQLERLFDLKPLEW